MTWHSKKTSPFLTGMRDGKDPDELAALCSDDLDFEIPGDADALPWIGHRRGRKVLAEFVRDLRLMTDPIKFEVHDVLASDKRAVVVGDLETRIKRTGRVTKSPFCLVFSIEAGSCCAVSDARGQL
jgi:ketosteroid isomerase-like protein